MDRHEEAASRRERLGSPVTGSSARSRRLREQFTSNRGTRQGRGRPVFTDSGKFAGTVFPDGVFFKAVLGSRHLLRTPPAIAYDVSVLRRAEVLGASRLVVLDKESSTRYEASMGMMWARGFRLDRGFGKQRALVLHHWRGNGHQPEVRPEPEPSGPQQLSLSGVRP